MGTTETQMFQFPSTARRFISASTASTLWHSPSPPHSLAATASSNPAFDRQLAERLQHVAWTHQAADGVLHVRPIGETVCERCETRFIQADPVGGLK